MKLHAEEEIIRAITDQGRLIEAGWLAYRLKVVPASAGQVQVEETRRAFYAGAQQLFASIMVMLDPGAEPTDADDRRMEAIDNELREFGEQFAPKAPSS